MGLETDITDIQSLNQNWPPVSDPRAQGADHIRNIKKAIQLTFPNLKQCLLNDAQFTALGTLIGDGSGTFTINGKLTVSDTLTVPTVTDWTTQQAVGAKDAEGRYLKQGDADGRYLKPGDADGRYIQRVSSSNTDTDFTPYFAGVNRTNGQIWLNYKDDNGEYKYVFAQPAGDYATNPALNTEITNRTNADTNLQNQINNCVQKTGDTMTGTLFQNPGTGAAVIASGLSGPASAGQAPWTPQFISKATGDGSLQAVFCARDFVGSFPCLSLQLTEQNGAWHELQFRSDNRLYTDSGNKFALTSELPSLPGNTLQVWHVDNVTSMSTINFPRAFSSAPLAIWCQDMDGSGVNNETIRNRTSTGFQVQTGNNNTRNITFFTLGYI